MKGLAQRVREMCSRYGTRGMDEIRKGVREM